MKSQQAHSESSVSYEARQKIKKAGRQHGPPTVPARGHAGAAWDGQQSERYQSSAQTFCHTYLTW